ncbi:MAG: glycosyltransferase, partial [Planctomycetota bacterium]
MRVALVVHGLPPYALTGVETHAQALATALAELGHEIEIFAPRPQPGLALYAQRREQRGPWAVTWVNVPGPGEPPADESDLADAFGAFLDRERPQVVHFEHLQKVGLGAVHEANKRALPSVYLAHDFYTASESPILLRPDLTEFKPGSPETEARNLLALGLLDNIESLGEYCGTVLEEQLEPEQWDQLQSILHDSKTALEGLPAAREEVRLRTERRRGAFNTFEARFATSRFLARKLSGTLGRAVDWRAAGIDTARFPEPGLREHSGPVRFGFMGGIHKHKGLHQLLDAFGALESGSAELVIHGDSSDRDYLRRVRVAAREVGAAWGGPFRQEDVPGVLQGFDVLVVPSLWVENAPFVIREAFAARRPVVAPHTPALEESVQNAVDGLFYERGSTEALTGVLRRFAVDDELRARLAQGIQPPRSIEVEAQEWALTYRDVLEATARRHSSVRLPAHLEGFAERYRELQDRPTRVLFAQVMNGLQALGSQMGLQASTLDLIALGAGRGSRLRDGIVDDQRAIDWLRRSVAQQEEIRSALMERSAWHVEQIQALREQLDWLGDQASEHERTVAALTADKREGRESIAALEEERGWLREGLADREALGQELERKLDASRSAVESLDQETVWLRQTLEQEAGELSWLRERVSGSEEAPDGLSDREAIERHFASLEEELGALGKHEEWLTGEVMGLVRALHRRAESGAPAADGPAG